MRRLERHGETIKKYPPLIKLVRQLETRYQLKIALVSDEGRDLIAYRMKKFKLAALGLQIDKGATSETS